MFFEVKQRAMCGILMAVAACSGTAKHPDPTSGSIGDAGSGGREGSTPEGSSGTPPGSGGAAGSAVAAGSGGAADGGGATSNPFRIAGICDNPSLVASCLGITTLTKHVDTDLAATCGQCEFDLLNAICGTSRSLPTSPDGANPGCWLFYMEQCQYSSVLGQAAHPDRIQQALSVDDIMASKLSFCADRNSQGCQDLAIQTLDIHQNTCLWQ